MSPRRLQTWPLLALLALATAPAAFADSGYSARATRTNEKIRIDGKLDEPAWATAPVLKNWHQTREKGKPAREDTEVRILYDRDNLYFGFHCLDSRPDKVVAYTVQNEGFLHQEDNVTIILDTFLDHRNAYYFWTNLLGVRTDGRIVDDGEAFSTDWQGEWESKGSRTSDGWVVEVRIPFANFQYDNAEEHTFGMLLDREQTSLQEWSNWTPDGVNSAKVSSYPHLTGLKDIAPRKVVTATPYVSTQLTLPNTPLASSEVPGQLAPTSHGASFRVNAGLDARVDPTDWASLKLTINPDFSQFDVDQDVLWLDTEERLIPERRQFFLESQQLFISPINLFFSRRIAPSQLTDRVWGGAQLTGKKNGLAFALLDTQSEEVRPDGTRESVNAGVARLQQDLGKRSSVSLIGLSRAGDEQHRLLGADANIHVVEEWFIQAQAAKTWSPDKSPGAEAYHVGIHRFDTLSEYWLDYEDIGGNFKDPLGYIPVTDMRALRAHAYYTWFTKLPVMDRLDVTYDFLLRRNHEGDLTRHRHNLNLQPYFGDHVALVFNGLYDYTVGYTDKIASAGIVINPNHWQGFSVTGLYGTFLGGAFSGVNGQLNLKLGPRAVVKLSGFYTRSSNVPQESILYGTRGDGHQWSAYGQLRYQFSPDLYTRVTYQRGQAVGLADVNQVNGQVIDAVLGWHYRPGSDLFVVYTEQPFRGAQEHRVLTKVSFSF